MLAADVTLDRMVPVGGVLPVRAVVPDQELLARYADRGQEASR